MRARARGGGKEKARGRREERKVRRREERRRRREGGCLPRRTWRLRYSSFSDGRRSRTAEGGRHEPDREQAGSRPVLTSGSSLHAIDGFSGGI
ncbi:hypothetical protein OJAV_G00084140 [Oryzias javanicus]|uniref:Uncharacterized protein n=1 Tax=Oryzias javanicus TaxID=123683 RepID=A0A3S2Q4S8_ORYJA|nr:hypothetical protein OJAV_G00084140 [Oryzias javanicus]